MEIPKNIRYDFFVTLIGIIIVFYIGYFWINNLPNKPEETTIFFFFVGYLLFIIGVIEMVDNYAMEYNIKRLEYELKKDDYLKKIKRRKIKFNEKSLRKVTSKKEKKKKKSKKR